MTTAGPSTARKFFGYLLHVMALLLLARGLTVLASLWEPVDPYETFARGVVWLGVSYVLWRSARAACPDVLARWHRQDPRVHALIGWCLIVLTTAFALAYALNPIGIDGKQAWEAERMVLMSRLTLEPPGPPRYVRFGLGDPSPKELKLLASQSARPLLPWSKHPDPTACGNAATVRAWYYTCDKNGHALWVGAAQAPLWRVHEVAWHGELGGDHCEGAALLVRVLGRWRMLKSWRGGCYLGTAIF